MTKYAKCSVCGYTVAIPDDVCPGDFICPKDKIALIASVEADNFNAARKLLKLDANAEIPLAQIPTPVTQTLYLDGSRTDAYTENGSITKPFKTIQSAVMSASGNVLINVAPGEYGGDFDLGLHVVSIQGSGINATFFTGNITAGDRAHSLEDFRIKATGSLTITDTVFARNLHLQCAVIVSGTGFLDGTNIYIAPGSGVVPLTANSSGGVMLNEGSIVAHGNVNAINHSLGTIVLFHSYAVNSSLGNPAINSSGGVLGVIQTSVANAGLGTAISMDNDGAASKANTITGVVCSGNIVCGSATTYVEGLNFVGFGALSGSALIYRPASRIDNDSSVTGDTVKDALETLALQKGIATIPMSFETNEQTATKIYFPFKVTINKIRSIVMKALTGTDNGTITGANLTGDSNNGVVTVALSAVLNEEDSASPDSNNVVEADSYYKLTTAKTTVGGKVLVALEYTRTS